jgi:peptidyl-prolyl cis-trans isomerase B (cyclophilin B)
VSPQARDRAREKRRFEKRQAVLGQRARDSRRNKQAIGVVLVLVLLIGGFIGVAFALNSGSKTTAGVGASAAASAAAGATPSARPTLARPVAGCVAPPAVPTDKRSRTLPDKKTAAGKTFVATIITNCGVIKAELFGTKAPQTVASFLSLAKSGYWADSPCQRLTTLAPLYVLQCGDPTGTGTGAPGYGYGIENPPTNFIYPAGTLAMARTQDPKSNGGQFFVVHKDTTINDPSGYSIFGKITSGMDIVKRIAAAGAAPADANQTTAPLQPISILAVHVTEKKA